jgi:hypothetical protein
MYSNAFETKFSGSRNLLLVKVGWLGANAAAELIKRAVETATNFMVIQVKNRKGDVWCMISCMLLS